MSNAKTPVDDSVSNCTVMKVVRERKKKMFEKDAAK